MFDGLRNKKILFGWCFGFVLSVAVIWLAGSFVLPLPDLWEFDEQLNIAVHLPGTIQSEKEGGGNGRTQFNAHGAQGLETVPPGEVPRICFMGDSFVQGGQVPLDDHFYNLYNRSIDNQRYAIAYGFSGRGCPVFLELIKTIPNVFSQIDTYVIFLGVDDILPNGTTQRLDPPEFIYKPRPRPLHGLRKKLYAVRASFLWEFLKQSKEANDDIRIRPGPVQSGSRPSHQQAYRDNKPRYDVFWQKFMQDAVALAGQRHVIIAIKETVPKIEAGTLQRTINRAQILEGFIDVARALDVEVIDMRDEFLKHFDQTEEFSKGFIWTYPGEGHWNRTGHQIVANSMVRHFTDNKHFVRDGRKR